MAPLVGIVVGVALLLFGRRLYWVFVAGIGFLTGLEFAPEVLPGQPDWVILVAALVAALVGAIVAGMAPRLSHALAFFLVIAVAIVGIIFQMGIAGEWPRRAPPRRA